MWGDGVTIESIEVWSAVRTMTDTNIQEMNCVGLHSARCGATQLCSNIKVSPCMPTALCISYLPSSSVTPGVGISMWIRCRTGQKNHYHNISKFYTIIGLSLTMSILVMLCGWVVKGGMACVWWHFSVNSSNDGSLSPNKKWPKHSVVSCMRLCNKRLLAGGGENIHAISDQWALGGHWW